MSDGGRRIDRLTFGGEAAEGLNEFCERQIILSTDALGVITAQDSDHRAEGILNEFANGFSRLSHEKSFLKGGKTHDTRIFVRLFLSKRAHTHMEAYALATSPSNEPVMCWHLPIEESRLRVSLNV